MQTQTDYWFTSMNEIEEANRRLGNHWFDEDTLRFFGCRVGRTVYGGRYFVSSEQDSYGAWNYQRRYTVRMATADGHIITVGEFGQYDTRAEAVTEVRRIIKNGGNA